MDPSVSIKAIVLLYMVLGVVSQYLPSQYFQQPMPGAMQGAMLPGRAPMGAGAPMMMPPMQMPQFSQRRLPVMVSPYHSKALDRKYRKQRKRRPKKYYSDSESSSDSYSSSSSREYLRKPKHGKKKRQVLTPVISYVTRNGRVVYQKKIKKENAGDWLEMGKNRASQLLEDGEED